MKVLIIGGGGREHALAHAISRSPLLQSLTAAPGNPGMETLAECIAIDARDHKAVIGFAKQNEIDLVVVGPEAPLVAGLVDDLEAAGITAFGPSRMAARLEGSKTFAREFCARHNIPQPDYAAFDNAARAIAHIREHYPDGSVVKADGLAAGKGVVVADTIEEAIAAVNTVGAHGSNVVIEERITGTEASLFALAHDGEAVFMGSAQDYKRAHDGDRGPNTGGMGAVSPAPALTDELLNRAWNEIVLPVVHGMKAEGAPYSGFLYCGLMLTQSGAQVIEFNCRFGDPEAQAILPRLKTPDLLTAIITAKGGALRNMEMRFNDNHAVTVIMANGGYPGAYEKGAVINGLEEKTEKALVFHAGTARNDSGAVIATGGRVLAVTGIGENPDEARQTAYAHTAKITWDKCFYRKDIAG